MFEVQFQQIFKSLFLQYNTLLQILKALTQEYMLFERNIGNYVTKLELHLYICYPYN